MDRFDGFRTENQFSAGSRNPEPFGNVIMSLLFRQWAGLTAQHDALAELSQFREFQFLFELLLSSQYDLQQLLGGCLQVGQQPNFFENRIGQVLRFVYDEHSSLTGTVTIKKPLVESHQLLTLGPGVTGNSELRQNKIEQLTRIHPGVK